MFNQKLNKGFLFIFFLSLSIGLNSFSQNNSPNPNYQFVATKDFVQSKNYYLLTLLQQLPAVKILLEKDSVLVNMAKKKTDGLLEALKICGRDGLCFTTKMKFDADEIKLVGQRLTALYQPNNALGKLVKKHLIPSGTYILFQNLPAREMLVNAWEQDAAGINFTIGVYAEGKKANYPNIDSISFNTKDPQNNNGYLSLLYNTTSLVALESKQNKLFFYPSLTCALYFLEMNEREQAADFEPMEKGENKAAFDKIKTIKWGAFKYSVIMVPGAGPEAAAEALSAEGMLRCRLAAIQYQKGLAPFILTSGGKVHPYKTKFCEATEMKKYLMEKLNIPENAILIDPHARHTSTNMRNAVRMIYRYGMPFSKPGITCTTRAQSTMIAVTLIERCIKELHEAPFKNGIRLSETEMEFYPAIEALHINPLEPMDP